MKILHLSIGKFGNPIPATAGGAVEQTIEALSKQHVRMGHVVNVKVLVNNKYEKEIEKIHSSVPVQYEYYYFNEGSKISFFVGVLKMILSLFNNNFDIINVHIPHLIPIIRLFNINNRKAKIVWHIHNKSKFAFLAKNSNVYCVGVSLSVLEQNGITSTYPQSHVIHNICRVDSFYITDFDEKESFVESKKINTEKFIIGYVGRLSQEKGIDILIESISSLSLDMQSRVQLVLCGSSQFKGASQSEYEKNLMKSTESMDVIWLGYVDNWELYKFYNVCDVVVVPSTWDEPAGQVLIESQSCGTQVIASNVGGIPEYISPYEMVFERGSVQGLTKNLLHTITSDSGRSYSSERSKWVLDKFNLNRISNEWIYYYENISQGRI